MTLETNHAIHAASKTKHTTLLATYVTLQTIPLMDIEKYSRNLISGPAIILYGGEQLKGCKTFLSLLMVIVFSLSVFPLAYSTTTIVDFNSRRSTPLVGQVFIVNVTVSNVINLSSWQTVISFDHSILNCTGLSLPPDHVFSGYSVFFPPPVINNENGTVKAFCSLEGTGSINGSGKLCTIQFQAKTLGVSSLNFINIMMKQSDGTYLLNPDMIVIPFEAAIGIVEVSASGFQANIFNVTQDTQTYQVAVSTNSTVTNFHFNQTNRELGFNVTGSDGTTGACIVTIPKALLNSTLIALLDDTAIRAYNNLTHTLPENETYCFTYLNYTHSERSFKILLTVSGDLTGDRKVDVRDVAIVAKAFGTTPDLPRWNPLADVDNNQKVDVRDVSFVAKNYGKQL
ncbi:hypothetical protein MUP01_02045 [Candidatus Bathyarchaeota archaeon]|nr:hypothetical protein [Candidatus Bathyarchaeota archaeon]